MKVPTFLLLALSLLANHSTLAQAGRSITSHNFRSQNAAQMNPSHQVRWASQNTRFNLLTKKQPAPNTCLHQWMPTTKTVQFGNQKQTIRLLQCQFCAKIEKIQVGQCHLCQVNPSIGCIIMTPQWYKQRATASNALAKGWTHSREEEKRGINGLATEQIFRPTNSRRFPPSMFRMRYVFHKNAGLEYLYLHPTDAHHMKLGSWHLARDNRTIHWKNAEGGIGSFQILEVTKDILKITTSKTTPPQKAVWLTNFAQAKA
jgi:hypothetical protein